MSKTRRQHFIPVSYLERFTSNGELHVVDLVKKKTFKTCPTNVANIRDFYSVDFKDEEKSNIVEDYFVEIEGRAKPILDHWIKTMEPPLQKDWHVISEFIAGMSVRIPEFRKKYLELSQYMVDLMNHMHLSSEEAYNNYRERYYQDTGKKLELGYEEIKQIYKHPESFSVILHQNGYVATMMKSIPEIAHIISKMTPWVLVGGKSKHRFIVSDNPVVLIDGDRGKPSYIGCGWLTKTVEVYFPISPLTCVVLLWDKEYKVLPASEQCIASANSYQLWYSTQYAFSAVENMFWQKGGKLYSNNELLFNEISDTKLKRSSAVQGPIPQIERPFDLGLIRKSAYIK